jgi:hypothetical protein
VAEDLADDVGIGEEGEDDHRYPPTARGAAGAGEGVNVEHTAQELGPGEATAGCGRWRRNPCPRVARRRSQGRLLEFGILLRGWRRWKKPAQAAAVGEDSVIAHRMGVGERDEGSQRSLSPLTRNRALRCEASVLSLSTEDLSR